MIPSMTCWGFFIPYHTAVGLCTKVCIISSPWAYHLRYGLQWKPFQREYRITPGEHAPVSTLTSTYGHAAVQVSPWHHHCVCKSVIMSTIIRAQPTLKEGLP